MNLKTDFNVAVTENEWLFIASYFECMIWADKPEGACLDFDDLDPDYVRQQTIEALYFYNSNEHLLNDQTIEQAGHDLWLTRCGHGAGFWDRGDLYVMEESGYDYSDLLTERAEQMVGSEYPEFKQESLKREGVQNDY